MKKTRYLLHCSFLEQKLIFILSIFLLLASYTNAQNTPVGINGRLKLVGKQLSNEYGNPVQLRGMSTHGLQWFGGCINNSSMDALANQWGADIVRAAMYVNEGGYVNNKAGLRAKVDEIVDMCEARGMYCLIDWHILTPGNPWANVNDAKEFFTIMAAKHAGKKHVLWEICNEPNGIDWLSVKGYAEVIIPIIRQYDKEAMIIVGTPDYSGSPHFAADTPLTGANAYHVMYTFHFYAGSHYNQSYVNGLLSRIPIFVTEWGVSNYTGNGGDDYANSQAWLNLFGGANSAGVKISWCTWNFADGGGSTDALNQGACGSGQWNNLKYSGAWVKDHLLNPADNFVGGNTGGTQSPFAGVITLPGVIEVENFDNGGEGVSYHDADVANLGGSYRTNYGVDIEACSEGGSNVGWTNAGEWLEYTVNVASAGTYKLDARVASANTGGNFHIEMNGANVSGTINAPGTSGWQTWTTVSKNITLSAGQQVLKLYIESSGFNINKLTITQQTASGIVNGAVYKIVAKHSGQACDVSNVSLVNGAQIVQWPYVGGNNQKWTAYDLGGGNWKLISVNTGKCMEVGGFSNADGGKVQQWEYVGHSYQQWAITAVDAGAFKVINKGSGKGLDVSGVSFANGAAIQQWTYGGGDNQKWYFQRVDGGAKTSAADFTDPASFSAKSVTLVYPNPAQNTVSVSLQSFAGSEKTISIFDMRNNLILEKTTNGAEMDLDLSTIAAAGIYVLTVKDEFEVKTERLVVEK